nr:hypothetical protein CR513_06367 [Ipomoea batatas]
MSAGVISAAEITSSRSPERAASCHGGDHTGLSGPGRAVKKVPTFPSPPGPLIKRFPVGEILKVGHDFLLSCGVHGERLERAGVLKRDGLPGVSARVERSAPRVGVEEPILVLAAYVVGPFHYVVEVGAEDGGFVLLFSPEEKPAFLLREWAPREGGRLAGGDHVLPHHAHAVVTVCQAVVVAEAEGDGAGVEAAGQAEPVARAHPRRAAQVELHRVVELVGVHAVDLRYVVVAVGGEPAAEAVEEFHGGETELRREHRVQEALAESPDPHY